MNLSMAQKSNRSLLRAFAFITLSNLFLWCEMTCIAYAFSPPNQRSPMLSTLRDNHIYNSHRYNNMIYTGATRYRSQTQQHHRLRSYTTLNLSSNENAKKNSEPLRKSSLLTKMYHILSTLPPIIQLVLLLVLYIFHLSVLTQNELVFPFQLWPNEKGQFQSIGLDSLAGIISFGIIFFLRKRQVQAFDNSTNRNAPSIPSLFGNMNNYDGSSPWHLPSVHESSVTRTTSVVALALLVTGYFYTGRFASAVELYLYSLAGMGFPLTIAMHRSLVVLGGHVAWVVLGSLILGSVLRPQPFFGGGKNYRKYEDGESNVHGSLKGDGGKELYSLKKQQKFKWFTNQWNTNWLWWTIGGYFISSWFFNIADFINQLILPAAVFELAGEGVVSQLINPENNDLVASIVGYLAPCCSAPWWEEILYRGFLLPALCLQMKFWPAVFTSGIIFSVHHVSTTGAIPLAILGWTWAALYAKSGNLLVTILIHAMWNSRVFLGSWLGL